MGVSVWGERGVSVKGEREGEGNGRGEREGEGNGRGEREGEGNGRGEREGEGKGRRGITKYLSRTIRGMETATTKRLETEGWSSPRP